VVNPPPDNEELRKHIDHRFDHLEGLIRSGFPDGDPLKHRAVHEGFITTAKDRSDLRKVIWERIITGGVWAGLGLIALAVWEYLKAGVRS
jgi:hypothetical protein